MIRALFDFLSSVDVALFRFLNGSLTADFLDKLLPFVTDTRNFYPAFLLLFAGLIIFGKYRGRVAALSIALGTVLADIISSKILKELFARPRPFETLDGVRQLVGAAGCSMPSSHAFNSFAAATMFAFFFKKNVPAEQNPAKKFLKERWVAVAAYFCAFLSAYSRIYVGVHYPFDSIVGAALGALVGALSCKAAIHISQRAGRPLD
ncbi:MAG: phosphatase PAP2 family protein [Endomicrobiia bacterium]|nr:phosphatase PAP2 family protein [Endomicrobiia bacterium]